MSDFALALLCGRGLRVWESLIWARARLCLSPCVQSVSLFRLKYSERGPNHGFSYKPSSCFSWSSNSNMFSYSLRDRLIEQLTAELQALKEELESFRLEVSETVKGREVVWKSVKHNFISQMSKDARRKGIVLFIYVFIFGVWCS